MARRRPFGGGRTDGRDARLRRAVLDDCCHAVSLGGGVGPRPFSGDRDYNRRMRTSTFIAAALAGAIAVPAFVSSQTGSSDVSPRARQIHERAIVVDTHDDTTQRLLFEKNFDIGVRHTNGNIDKPAHNGLTPFGKDVVRELNRLGVMVDISHVADKTFYDALEITKAPVIASHSSCRAISNSPRNMTDDMLRALAKNGGVVMINYEASFLSEEYRVASDRKSGNVVAQLAAMSKKCGGDEACSTLESARVNREAMDKGELPKVGWEKIIEHIDHAVKAAGVDHVGLGSDFDGATMPIGMEDASKLPRITDALLKKGYSEADVEKILGGNILRVMEAVERVAHE